LIFPADFLGDFRIKAFFISGNGNEYTELQRQGGVVFQLEYRYFGKVE
jgi:hypothetical protein